MRQAEAVTDILQPLYKGGDIMTDNIYTKDSYIDIVKQMAEEIKYGQIIITIQDGKVVQIEQNKKIRIKN